MTAVKAMDNTINDSKVIFRLEGYGRVTMYNDTVDNPDLIRECQAIMERCRHGNTSNPTTYTALALIDKYGGRILEVEGEGITVRIS